MTKLSVLILLCFFGALAASRMYPLYIKYKTKAAYREMQVSLGGRMKEGNYRHPNSDFNMPYRLYIPPSYNETETSPRFPIVLALHSGRGRGSDNIEQLDQSIEILLSDTLQGIEPVFVLAPQAAVRTHWVNYDKFTPPFRNFDQDRIPQSDNLKAAIRILKDIIGNYRIDPRRVYITGISMGGEGAWDAVSYNPDLFAGAIVLNGAGDPEAVPRAGMMPIRFFHGSKDTITPVENSRELNESLSKHLNNATYRELKGAEHDIRELVYDRTLFKWMLAQQNQTIKTTAVNCSN